VVGYLEAAVELATSRGYLPLRSGLRWLRDMPAWLADLQEPGGMQELAYRLGSSIPAAVLEFWSNPSFVRLLDSWRWQDYLIEQPRIVTWDSRKHLLVCSHPHSGGIGAVELTAGHDPPMYWGWEDEKSPMRLASEKFSEHVRLSVERGPD
jgi:hypothetical protein